MAETTVPGKQPGTYASTRMKWDDPLLEPKQQHRFICYFPVYMAMGSESDSKKLADSTTSSETWAASAEKAFPAGNLGRMKAAKNSRSFALATIGDDDEAGTEADLEPAREWFDKNKRLAAGALAARISSYVVSSFTPPSYGATIGMAPIAATPGDETTDPTKTKLKMDQAQITLVSTLQDDLHFSLNYLYNLYAPRGDDAENVLVEPYLFPAEVWGGGTGDKYLTVLDMGARQWPGPDVNAELLGRGTGDAARDMAKLFPSQIVGIHKFRAPFVTGISFSEYSYKGEAFLEATVTLGPSIGVADFYSYETYNAGGKRGGDTRYGGYSGLQEARNVNTFQEAIAATYGDYPNFSIKNTGDRSHVEGKWILKENLYSAKRITDGRKKWIDEDINLADRSGVIGRRGTLDRILSSKILEEAEEQGDDNSTQPTGPSAGNFSLGGAQERREGLNLAAMPPTSPTPPPGQRDLPANVPAAAPPPETSGARGTGEQP